jgi:EAL domain-containing protein (putative c-di-GMP-specific phosphodiesterase class I)
MSKSKTHQDRAALPVATPVARPATSGGLGASDIIVLLAMGTVAVALGFGLTLQAGFSTISAALAASVVFAAAATMHLQLMRIRTLEQVVEAAPALHETAVSAPVPVSRAVRPVRQDPTLPRATPETDVEDLDRSIDRNAGQLSLVAAALRDAVPVTERQRAPFVRPHAPVVAEPVLERLAEEPAGWAEPGAVDALVRQYAEELDRGIALPEATRVPEPALPPIFPQLKAAPPMPRLPAAPVPTAAPENPLAAAIRRAAEGEVEVHLQPVVAFSDRKARLYEVFPKITDATGKVLGLADYQPAATAMGLALAIERAAILRCCGIQRKLSEKGRARAMIVRLSSAAIRDRAFLQRLLADMQADALLADLMIFEIDQAEIEQGDGAERENMELLAKAGFRFALGSADTLALEVEELTVRRIGFVRIAAHLLAADGNAQAVSELRQGAVETILTGVTTDDHARLGQEFGLVLGQGSLFSEAKPLRADVVESGGRTRVA